MIKAINVQPSGSAFKGRFESRMLLAQQYIAGLNRCLEEILQQDVAIIADVVFDAYCRGKHVFVMGNGGSATTASHFARDLRIGTAVEGKPRVQANSITDNIATITAVANDRDYSHIFQEQLIGQLAEGDVVIGISGSGNSPNVLRAMEFARSQGAITVAFVGFGGGNLKDLVDRAIVLSSRDYGQVEDAHSCLAHIIACLVKEKIVNGE